MAIRVIKLASELNIGLVQLESMLNTLGYQEGFFSPNSKIPDAIAVLVRGLCSDDTSLLKLVEMAVNEGVYGVNKI